MRQSKITHSHPELHKAEKLNTEKRYDDAINALSLATKAGDLTAMTRLGKCLIIGGNYPSLPTEGAKFILDAANLGHPEATNLVSVFFATGVFLEKNWNKALNTLVIAAELGWKPSQTQLMDLSPQQDLVRKAKAKIYGKKVWQHLAQSIQLNDWFKVNSGTLLHSNPVIQSFPNLLPARICNRLMMQSKSHLQRAQVYDSKNLQNTTNETRTNTQAQFNLIETDFIQCLIQERMSAACGLPVKNMEATAILHYDIGEQIINHYDFVDPNIPNYAQELSKNGQRIVTFLIYLNNEYEGGETAFPKLNLSHKGKAGEGLFFVNSLPSGEPNLRTLHAGKAPTSGEKWIISQFIRNREIPRIAPPA